ncbi:claudin-10 isoform X2 [Pangasianodon hypophthalmus]|uniref:claudin-10 isoform X2 n=1 Tax=Pangasianodon hypophthalmus TaxID=310915 RepID=UPI0023080BEE|nr:claudin-10 isoform X2 [Pangasianodon hypophthalmus]
MNRTAMMYLEIGCFLCCICGWILICSTLPTEYWNFSEVGDAVLTTVNYYSNLWMDCVSDTTGVSDCKYYPSLMALPVFLHVTRALAIVSVILGFWGSVLTLIGMKCTKIGGSELVNTRITLAAAFTYMASGLCGMAVYSMWGNRIRAEFVDVNYKPQKFELGAALFIGWGGSSLVICGSAVLCYFSGRERFSSGSNDTLVQADAYTRARSRGTYVTARTRGTYTLPAYSKANTAIMPPLFQSGRESKGTRKTQRTYTARRTAASMPLMDSYV